MLKKWICPNCGSVYDEFWVIVFGDRCMVCGSKLVRMMLKSDGKAECKYIPIEVSDEIWVCPKCGQVYSGEHAFEYGYKCRICGSDLEMLGIVEIARSILEQTVFD